MASGYVTNTHRIALASFKGACRINLKLTPPGQNGRHFAADISRCIFINEKFCISIKISLKFVTKGPIDNNQVLV